MARLCTQQTFCSLPSLARCPPVACRSSFFTAASPELQAAVVPNLRDVQASSPFLSELCHVALNKTLPPADHRPSRPLRIPRAPGRPLLHAERHTSLPPGPFEQSRRSGRGIGYQPCFQEQWSLAAWLRGSERSGCHSEGTARGPARGLPAGTRAAEVPTTCPPPAARVRAAVPVCFW
jgi:hypothetical protein